METLTREEIEMCEIAVGQLMDSRDLTPENMKKWEALWDKLERIQRETCLTPRALDLLSEPACCASFVLDGTHHRDCRLAQTASQ